MFNALLAYTLHAFSVSPLPHCTESPGSVRESCFKLPTKSRFNALCRNVCSALCRACRALRAEVRAARARAWLVGPASMLQIWNLDWESVLKIASRSPDITCWVTRKLRQKIMSKWCWSITHPVAATCSWSSVAVSFFWCFWPSSGRALNIYVSMNPWAILGQFDAAFRGWSSRPLPTSPYHVWITCKKGFEHQANGFPPNIKSSWPFYAGQNLFPNPPSFSTIWNWHKSSQPSRRPAASHPSSKAWELPQLCHGMPGV